MRIQTGFLLHDVSVMRQAIFNRHVRPFTGITSAQSWALIELARHDDRGMTQVELARLRKVGKVSLGQMIDKLEQAGLVTRRSDTKDRRSKKIYLTAKGHSLMRQMQDAAIDLTCKLAQGLSLDEQRTLRDALAIMKRNLSTMDLESASTRRKRRSGAD